VAIPLHKAPRTDDKGAGPNDAAEPGPAPVRLTRAFSEFRLRSPESTGVRCWESMAPRDHPAEEREAGILAPAFRSAATVGRSYAFQEVAENREEDEPAERT
jgi:hypothetical protein